MTMFEVEDDLARLVEKLANPKPFENLTFSVALRRVLHRLMQANMAGPMPNADNLLAELTATKNQPKKMPSPNAQRWAESVPELQRISHLNSWRAICDHLKIKTGGDSARRKLKNWVKENRPEWPGVPEISGE